jgi:hypothetical protein
MSDVRVFPKGKKYYDNFNKIFGHGEQKPETTSDPVWLTECIVAEKAGWESELDRFRGGNWCRFTRGDEIVWAVSSGWIRATRTGIPEENCKTLVRHKRYASLEAALRDEGGVLL